MKQKISSKIINELVYGGHLTAFEASAMLIATMLLQSDSVHWTIVAIPYFVVQIIYSYNHQKEEKFDRLSNPERSSFVQRNSSTASTRMFLYILMLGGFILFTNFLVAAFVAVQIVLGILYTERFKGIKILGFKNIYTSLVWVSSILLLPLSDKNSGSQEFYSFLIIILFLTVLANTIFFDIKDTISDKEQGIMTLPAQLGHARTMAVINGIRLCSIAILVIGVELNHLPKIFLIFIFTVLYGLIYSNNALHAGKKGVRLISYLVADTELSFWLITLLIAKTYL